MLFAPCAFPPLGQSGYKEGRHGVHSEGGNRIVDHAPWASGEGNSAAYTCFVEDHCCRSSYGVCLRDNLGEAELTSGSLVSCRREHGPSSWASVDGVVCCYPRLGLASPRLLSEEEEDGIQGCTGGALVVVVVVAEMKDGGVVGGGLAYADIGRAHDVAGRRRGLVAAEPEAAAAAAAEGGDARQQARRRDHQDLGVVRTGEGRFVDIAATAQGG